MDTILIMIFYREKVGNCDIQSVVILIQIKFVQIVTKYCMFENSVNYLFFTINIC